MKRKIICFVLIGLALLCFALFLFLFLFLLFIFIFYTIFHEIFKNFFKFLVANCLIKINKIILKT